MTGDFTCGVPVNRTAIADMEQGAAGNRVRKPKPSAEDLEAALGIVLLEDPRFVRHNRRDMYAWQRTPKTFSIAPKPTIHTVVRVATASVTSGYGSGSTSAPVANRQGVKKSKPFACESGKASFKRKADLSRHVKRVHKLIKDAVCPHCRKEIGVLYNLRRHIRRWHKEKTGTASDPSK